MEELNQILVIIAIVLSFIIAGLAFAYFTIGYMNKNRTKGKVEEKEVDKKKIKGNVTVSKDSVYNFMEFDEIKDNMIVRKNRTQYVMVIQCQGVNYDLLSEQEKISVEEGFVQFLNTLRFPIQLYIQTRSLNLKDIIEEYKGKIKNIEADVNKIRDKIKIAQEQNNKEELEKLKFDEKRKINVLEYGADITEYIGRLSLNKNVLQQKTYIIVSYFTNEFGSVSNYSKEEIDGICFSELYTRCQAVTRSLASSEVTGKILDSEGLSELLYVAYNRDDADLLQFTKVLDAEYNCLYNTGKDILQKKQDIINEALDEEAIKLVTDSILDADNKRQSEAIRREKMIKQRALEIAAEYENQMESDLYDETVKQIEAKTAKRITKAKEESTKEDKKLKRKAI